MTSPDGGAAGILRARTTRPGGLLVVLAEARDEVGADVQYVHDLAAPPGAFGPLAEGLEERGLAGGARVIYEKAVRHLTGDLPGLDRLALSVFDEDQVFADES